MTTNAATPLPQTGLLVVFADLGDQVTEHEFHDWYDNEHIPLRTATLKEFETAARFKLVQDGEVLHAGKATAATPTWGAIYTINDNDIFGKEGYTKLRANRSAREGDLVKRLGLLDRRIYKLVSLPSSNPTSSDPHPALVLVNNLTPSPSSSPDEFLALLESAEERYKNVPGFIRTRRYETVDVVRSGQLVNSGVEDAKKDVGKYFEITGGYPSFVFYISSQSSHFTDIPSLLCHL